MKSLLNQPSSFDDGYYSSINNFLNKNELNVVIEFLKLNNNDKERLISELKIFGRFRQNHELFYAKVYDSLHKRQSSVCKWKTNQIVHYGIIEKFVKYQDKEIFIANEFIGKRKLTEIYAFSDTYKTIFEVNNLDKYFTVFSNLGNENSNLIACFSNSIISTCIMTKLNDSEKIFVTDLIGFEHD